MRLIDADALPSGRVEWEDIIDAPTVDAVPVVRCKDCRHWCEMQNLTGACLRLCAIDGALWMGTDATDFCSFAERRDDE
jgi:hypothetical protein